MCLLAGTCTWSSGLKQLSVLVSLTSSLRTCYHVRPCCPCPSCGILSLQLVISTFKLWHRSSLQDHWVASVHYHTLYIFSPPPFYLQHISAHASHFHFCCGNSVLPFLMVLLSVLLHSPPHIGDDTQQHLKNIMLERVTLDAVCDVVNFEHMKELQCMGISDPQEVWLLYTCVCIITVSYALKTPRPPKVSVRCCFLPIFCWWSDQMSFAIEEHNMLLCQLPIFKLCMPLGV